MKTILAPLFGSEHDRQIILQALAVAGPLGAHVTALLPGGYVSEFLPADVYETGARARDPSLREVQAMLAAQVKATRQLFEEVVQQAGAVVAEAPEPGAPKRATICFQTRRGDTSRAIQEAAVVHDVILFQRNLEGLDTGLESLFAVKDALQAAGRPLLVLPPRLPDPFAATAAIAWNGSLEGAHAVTAAIPFIEKARAVHVLTAATSNTKVDRGEELRRYLGWRGIAASVHPIEPGAGPVGAALLARAAELGADLLVTGGYSHSRLRQTMLGGVTHHLLRHAALPVLMAR